jgi:hypothetical protein
MKVVARTALLAMLLLLRCTAGYYFRGDPVMTQLRPQAHGRRAGGWRDNTVKNDIPRFAVDTRAELDLTNETHPWKLSFAFDNSSFVIPSIPITQKSGALIPGLHFVFTYRSKQILAVSWEYAGRHSIEFKKGDSNNKRTIPIIYTWEQARGDDIELGTALLFATSTGLISVLFCMAITDD